MTSRAIAYLRVSTDDQRLGVEAQRQSIETYAQAQGLEIVAWHIDRGVSGATPVDQRPGLSAALLDMRKTKSIALVVAKRDRLARDVLISALVEKSLPKGASILSADNTANGNAPSDALMRTILDGMSQYERALIRSRTKSALQAKRARGQRAGTVPYGFTADNAGTLAPDLLEQRTIAEVRRLLAEGFSHRAIVQSLTASNVVSRSGRPLGLSQVQRILKVS